MNRDTDKTLRRRDVRAVRPGRTRGRTPVAALHTPRHGALRVRARHVRRHA